MNVKVQTWTSFHSQFDQQRILSDSVTLILPRFRQQISILSPEKQFRSLYSHFGTGATLGISRFHVGVAAHIPHTICAKTFYVTFLHSVITSVKPHNYCAMHTFLHANCDLTLCWVYAQLVTWKRHHAQQRSINVLSTLLISNFATETLFRGAQYKCRVFLIAAINCDSGGRLQNRLETSPGRRLGKAVRNKHNIVWLQL